mgnify:CR=1 FL=1
MKKLYADAASALDGVLKDNMLIAAGGFGLCRFGQDFVHFHQFVRFQTGVIACRLRTIGAVFGATAGFDREQRGDLHLIRIEMRAVHAAVARGQRIAEHLGGCAVVRDRRVTHRACVHRGLSCLHVFFLPGERFDSAYKKRCRDRFCEIQVDTISGVWRVANTLQVVF